jgi:hypothetical protein
MGHFRTHAAQQTDPRQRLVTCSTRISVNPCVRFRRSLSQLQASSVFQVRCVVWAESPPKAARAVHKRPSIGAV